MTAVRNGDGKYDDDGRLEIGGDGRRRERERERVSERQLDTLTSCLGCFKLWQRKGEKVSGNFQEVSSESLAVVSADDGDKTSSKYWPRFLNN